MANPLDKSSRQDFISKNINKPKEFFPPDALIIFFIIMYLEEDIYNSRKIMNELLERNKQVIRKTAKKMGIIRHLPSFFVNIDNKDSPAKIIMNSLLNEFFNYCFEEYENSVYYDQPANSNIAINFNNFKEINNLNSYTFFVRKNWWENISTTREHEVGIRMKNAFEENGIKLSLLEPKLESISNINDTNDNIAIVDMQTKIILSNEFEANEFLSKIRKKFKYVIGIYLDEWRKEAQNIALKYEKYIDANWMANPLLEDIYSVNKTKKVILFPFPIGIKKNDVYNLVNNIKENDIKFVGGIEQNNVSRVFWYYNIKNINIVNFDFSTHRNYNIAAYESYLSYLNRLSVSKNLLNFSQRMDGSRSITGRTFEILLTNGLLIQEYSPETSFYLEPNQHFIEFKNLNELVDIINALQKNPNEFESIRKRANSFYNENYNDHKLVKFIEGVVNYN